MPHSRLHEPIDTRQLKMRNAGPEAGLLDVVPQQKAARARANCRDRASPRGWEESLLKMFKEFFTKPNTAH